MHEQLDPHATKALTELEEEARYLHYTCAGTDHLLLALSHKGSPASSLLEQHGATYDSIKEYCPEGNEGLSDGLIPPGRHTRFVIRAARDIAHMTGNRPVVQDLHLLLGLFCVGDNAAMETLKQLGCDQQALCDQAAERLSMQTPFVASKHTLSAAARRRQEILETIIMESQDRIPETLVHTIPWMDDMQLRHTKENLRRLIGIRRRDTSRRHTPKKLHTRVFDIKTPRSNSEVFFELYQPITGSKRRLGDYDG